MIVGVFATDKLSVFAEVSASDFDVNTGWTMSGDITTGYTVKNGNRAYSTGKAKIGDIGVTATFVKQADRNDGASYLSANGNNQAAYGATEDMFYGNPDPASIPALGMNTQPSNGCGGPLGSWEKYNADGEYEVGSVTFKFDRKVTDPILDLSGLGGYVSRVGSYVSNGRMILVGLGSFNSTNLHLATEGITVEPLTSNSNLVVDNNIIQVKDRNTHTRAVVEDNSKYNWIQFGDAYGRQYNVNSPSLVPAGTGSVKLKGTFDKVTFKLYHQATPYSDFSHEEYGTHSSYFANSIDGNPANGDGINGMNVINTESVKIGGQLFNGDQNWDLFRASLRLLKPSSIGDKVWLDENKDGIQNAGEAGVEGVTVKLLDKDGNPVKDFNGNLVQDQVTDANGNYKFENLPAGEYVVQVVTKDGQTLTTKGQGAADKDSDLDPKTGKTDVIKLEANENITNVDAGIVPAKEYKVDYEFQPSKAEGTPEKLPEEVLKQLPEAKEKLKDGSEVPSPKEFTPVKDEANKGTWTFEAWDKETATINGANEHVTGTWVFTKDPVKEYKLDYEFKPSDAEGTPKTLPEGVLKQLPEAKEKLADGTEVPSPKDFTPVKDEVNKGTWTFEAWDKETATIKGADEHVTGTWKFTKDEEPKPTEYKVTHEFKSGTPGRELPEEVNKLRPADQTGKKDREEVTPTQPAKTEVPVEGGKWVFKNYDKTDATIDKADEHFVGTWVFEEDKTPEPEKEYKVTHEFKSGTPGKDLPDEVKALLPKNQTGKVDGNTVVPTEPNQTQVTTADGTWIFKGYDKKDATINGKDENVTGTWVFIPKEDSQPKLGSVYVKYVTEDGKVLEAEKEVLVNEKVGTPYTTDKKTFDGYEFVEIAKDSAPANGQVKDGVQHVTYVYKKTQVTPPAEEKGNVYVKYVTEDGTVLEKEKEVVVNAEVGTKYTTDKKTFEGYEFVEMAKDSAPANGKVVKGDQHVTYVYKKTKVNPDPKPNTGNVYVQYVTEDGRILSERVVKRNAPVGENYYTERKNFYGFRFIGMGRNSADTDGKVVEGNLYVTYVYEEIDKHDSTFPFGQNRHHDKGTPVVTIVENSDRVISTIETTEVKERQEELNNNKELNATDKTTDKVEKSEGLNAEDKKESTNNENDYVENYEEEFVEKNKSVNDGNKAPKTQDPGIALYAGLAVASSALLGLFEVKRRKNK